MCESPCAAKGVAKPRQGPWQAVASRRRVSAAASETGMSVGLRDRWFWIIGIWINGIMALYVS
jgi:hypothetical protein